MIYSIRLGTSNKFWKALITLAIALLALAFDDSAAAEEVASIGFVVVVKETDAAKRIERKLLRHIFMGNNTSSNYKAVHLPVGHPLRITFNTKVIGLTESRIQAYWAQLKFTGRGNPPKEIDSVEKAIALLQENPNIAAYLPADIEIPDGLIVVFP